MLGLKPGRRILLWGELFHLFAQLDAGGHNFAIDDSGAAQFDQSITQCAASREARMEMLYIYNSRRGDADEFGSDQKAI